MRENLTLDDVTPEQRQVIQKAITLIDYPSLFAQYGAQLRKLKGAYWLQVKAIQALGSAKTYYIELSVGNSIFGGFLFAAVRLDKASLTDGCGQHTVEPLLKQWAQLETTHHAYAIQPLCFLPEHLALNAAVIQEIVCTLKQHLQLEGEVPTEAQLSQLLGQ